MPQRVYIDTCILRLVFDEPIPREVAGAVGALCDFDDLEFVTSRKTLQELLNHPDQVKRSLLKLIYRVMSKLPEANLVDFVPAFYGAVMFGEATYGGGAHRPDPIFTKLREVFKKDDAEHIFQAAKGQCRFFLTVDSRTILKKARRCTEQLQKICPELQFVTPTELVAILRHNTQKADGTDGDT